MIKTLATIAASAALVVSAALPSYAAPSSANLSSAGKPCAKQSQVLKSTPTVHLVCKKNSKGKLVWTKRAVVQKKVSNSKTAVSASYIPISIYTAPVSSFTAVDPVSTTAPVAINNPAGSPEVVIAHPSEKEVPIPGAPIALSNLQIVPLDPAKVSVSFTPIDGITNYTIYVRYEDSFTSKGVSYSAPSAVFDDLAPNTTYTACALYQSALGESNKSCNTFTTPQSEPLVVSSYPINVAPNVSTTSTSTEISISWRRVPAASRYVVCYATVPDSSWQCGGEIPIGENSVKFTGLTPSKNYAVTVTAVFPDSSLSARGISTITTQSDTSAPYSAPVLQPEPTTTPTPAPAQTLEPTPEPTPSTSVEPTTTTTTATNSTPTQEPAPTPTLQIGTVTSGSATINWTNPTGENVQRWNVVTRQQSSYSSTGVAGADSSFSIGDLAPGTGYEVTLVGYTQDGRQLDPITVTFTTAS